MTTTHSYDGTSRSLDLAHGRLHYHEAGQGFPLIMLHGSGPGVHGWANFEGNLPVFAERYRSIIPDLPGYGESDAAPGNPIDAAIAATLALMDRLALDQVHLIGNSFGAIVASHVAARNPERVARLAMIGGVGLNLFTPFPNEGINLLVDFLEDPRRERLIAWLRSMVYDQALVTPELIEDRWRRATDATTLEVSRRIYSREAVAAMAAAQFITPTWQHLADIHCPSLLLWGRDDRVSTVDRAILPMRMIPRCELHVFPHCGHWAMIEQKAAFERVVLDFLER